MLFVYMSKVMLPECFPAIYKCCTSSLCYFFSFSLYFVWLIWIVFRNYQSSNYWIDTFWNSYCKKKSTVVTQQISVSTNKTQFWSVDIGLKSNWALFTAMFVFRNRHALLNGCCLKMQIKWIVACRTSSCKNLAI